MMAGWVFVSLLVASSLIGQIESVKDGRYFDLRTYPDRLTVLENRDAVFDCRDEGPLRAQVEWLRPDHPSMPLGAQTSRRGRLILRRVRVQHAGVYTCSPIDTFKAPAKAAVNVYLQVQLRDNKTEVPVPKSRGSEKDCSPLEFRCRSRECIPREFLCDGEIDCSDGSDELACKKTPHRFLAKTTSVTLPPTPPAACERGEKACPSGDCVNATFFCDGEIDCPDAYDELHCPRGGGRVRTQALAFTENAAVTWADPLDNRTWGEWSPWGPCDTKCEQSRRRQCTQGGGQGAANCARAPTERRKCTMKECKVDGGWGLWTEWTSCSQSCGKGTRRRYRKCDRPAPNYGGAYCRGSDGQQEYCAQPPCPDEGQWGQWGMWGSWAKCSVWSNGTRNRTRVCKTPTSTLPGSQCSGLGVEVAPCSRCPRSLKIGMKPVRVTVARGQLVNFTCHYRCRGVETLFLELDPPSLSQDNEVVKDKYRHAVVKDSLTPTRCGARRRWTLRMGGETSLVRCIVRDGEGKVLGKAEARATAVPSKSHSLQCYGDKNCEAIRGSKSTWKTNEVKIPPSTTKHLLVKAITFTTPPRIPTVKVHPVHQVVREGGAAHVMCLASGDAPLEVAWRAEHGGLPVTAAATGGLLVFSGIRTSDAGKYMCTATNDEGETTKEAHIVVDRDGTRIPGV